MKLVELLSEMDSKKSQSNINGLLLGPGELKAIENYLFQCDEFKNVVRINYIDLPSYLVDEETGEPVSANRNFIGGNTSIKQVESYRAEGEREFKFNKIIDLYSITLNKRYDVNADISKPGVWVYPTMFDHETFTPKNQIRVIWEPEQLRDALKLMNSTETAKDRLRRMFEDALENMEPNLPCTYVLTLRCSERSISNPEEVCLPKEPTQPLKDDEEQQPIVYSGSTI